MTLKASSPGKILLFGEWAVLEGSTGLAMAVSPRLNVTWRASTTPSDESVVIVRGDGKVALWDPRKPMKEQIQIPEFLHKTVGMISSLMMRSPEARREILKGGDLRIERSWSLEYGLGSSSGIVACLLEIFCSQSERIAKWQMGRDVLRDVQGGRASALDLAAQLRGAFVAVSAHKPKPVMNLKVPEELCFVHAGNKADTSQMIATKPLSTEQIQGLGKSSAAFLASGNWLQAMKEHAAVLKESALWPPILKECRETWIAEGLVQDMKSCGAGGGDTWMMWCESNKQAALKEACEKMNWHFVKYNAEDKGVSIHDAV